MGWLEQERESQGEEGKLSESGKERDTMKKVIMKAASPVLEKNRPQGKVRKNGRMQVMTSWRVHLLQGL